MGHDHDDLSVVAQCRLLKVARSTLYWRSARVSEDDLRRGGKPQAVGAADARDADRGDLPETEHQPLSSGACCLSLPFTRPDNRPAEAGWVRGHHLVPTIAEARVVIRRRDEDHFRCNANCSDA